jgi:hypothetical protein
MSSSEVTHLLVAHAAALDQEGRPLWAAPGAADLPQLAALLPRLRIVQRLDTGADTPALPHELVLARLLGLPAEPGRVPWAAYDTGTTGTPCGWIHPCHLQVGADRVLLAPPAQLALTDAEAHALFEAAAPLLAEDGIALRYVAPGAWLAMGEPLRDLPTWSLERLSGRTLTPEVLHAGDHPHAARWKRLHSEMQMLFYAHPVNDERARRRQPLVNAIWICGAGALEALPTPVAGLAVDTRLRDAALALDATAYAAAWRALDADAIAPLLARLRAGHDVRLTLAGERSALTLAPAEANLGARLRRWLRPSASPTLALLETL